MNLMFFIRCFMLGLCFANVANAATQQNVSAVCGWLVAALFVINVLRLQHLKDKT